MIDAQDILDRAATRSGTFSPPGTLAESRRQVSYELVSGGSGLLLALFMVGHMGFVASILMGTRAFDWVAGIMEATYVAQPAVVIIFLLFLVHAVMASRKIPARIRDRRRFAAAGWELKQAGRQWQASGREAFPEHVESRLWIWQVRTGMVVLVLGSFHLGLMTLDIFTALFGDRTGIEAATSMARTREGLVWMYLVLLWCVEFHAGVGLFRLAVKWGAGARLSRRRLAGLERLLLWFFVGLGLLVVVVLAGWIDPPLAFLLADRG